MTGVADSGPVIHLSWIDKLGLLNMLYGDVIVPPSVHAELFAPIVPRLGIEAIQMAFVEGRIAVVDVVSTNAVLEFRRTGLGRGESEALVVCQELAAESFLTDDREARIIAERLGLTAKGTLGVLRDARRVGLIDSVVPWAVELQRKGQWIGLPIIEQLRREEGL